MAPHSLTLQVLQVVICSSFVLCFCFHYTKLSKRVFIFFSPPKARPKSLCSKKFFFFWLGRGWGNAGRKENVQLFFPPGHALLICAPKDWIAWITPHLSALRPACCNASSKTKQPTPVPNIGNRFRGHGRGHVGNKLHRLLHARTDSGRQVVLQRALRFLRETKPGAPGVLCVRKRSVV